MSTDLATMQNEFAARIRDPESRAVPDGVNPARMRVYEELIYNGVEELLGTCFPVLSEVISDELKQSLIRGFLKDHPAKTPLFYEVPEEFLSYLLEVRSNSEDPLYLTELAHFEWMELAVELSDAKRPQDINPNGDLLSSSIVIEPLLEVVGYHYPVHEICNSFTPTVDETGAYYLAFYRDADGVVQTMVLSALAARLLQLLKQYELSGEQVIDLIAKEMPDCDLTALLETGLETLQTFLAEGMILGTRG